MPGTDTQNPDRILEPISARRERRFDQKVIRDLADKYGKTPAQIVSAGIWIAAWW